MPCRAFDWRRFAAGLGMCAAAMLLSQTALAHVFPKQQQPGAGTTVTSPAQVSIRFDGPLEPAFTTLTVTDATGKQINVEKAHVDPQQPTIVSVPLPVLTAGHYTVHWVAVAADGHRTHGDYSFDVKQP